MNCKMLLEQYLKDNPKKHLIFDFDETLYKMHTDWWLRTKLIQEHFLALDADLTSQCEEKAYTHREIEVAFTQKYGDDAKKIIFEDSSLVEQEHTPVIERHKELVDFIHEHHSAYTIHIWSSNMTTTFVPVLEDDGIYQYIDCAIGKDSVDLIKGYPDGFYKIREKHAGKRGDYLMIGNSKAHDGKAAQQAGIDYVYIPADEVNWQQR